MRTVGNYSARFVLNCCINEDEHAVKSSGSQNGGTVSRQVLIQVRFVV